MSGRQKIKVHLYDDNGAYLRSFETIEDFRESYYPNDIGKRPIFTHSEFGMDYHYIKNLNLIALKERPGREMIRKIVAIHRSPYCRKQDLVANPIELINLRGDVIAEFKTQNLLLKLMPELCQSTVTQHLKYNMTKKINSLGFHVRYKKDPKE
jgi:hypothetical protein